MKTKIMKTAIFTIVTLSILFAAGCSKLTTENYNKLRVGMSYDEVTSLLGKPDDCDGAIGFKSCTWGDEKKNINVNFGGEKVLVFSAHNL